MSMERHALWSPHIMATLQPAAYSVNRLVELLTKGVAPIVTPIYRSVSVC